MHWGEKWLFALLILVVLLTVYGWLMVFNATFNNMSVISWRSVLLVDEIGRLWENHWAAWTQTFSNQFTCYDVQCCWRVVQSQCPPEFTTVFSGARVSRSFVAYVCFIDRCLSFCTSLYIIRLCHSYSEMLQGGTIAMFMCKDVDNW
jgi:hypothetical protein